MNAHATDDVVPIILPVTVHYTLLAKTNFQTEESKADRPENSRNNSAFDALDIPTSA